MLTSRSLKLFGYLLVALLTMQSVTAYDSHSELDIAAQHLPPHHQDAADGTPHLDQSASENDSAAHANPGDVQKMEEGRQPVVLEQLPPSEHVNPDIAQDCNHCCHCHGSTSLCLPPASFAIINFTGKRWSPALDAGFPHGYISAPFRPPIA